MSAHIKARARAAVLGAFVADAATMPLHWIYDISKLTGLLEQAGSEHPEFFPTPSCPFYQAEFGEQSPYGAELVPLLRSLAASGGLDAADYSTQIVDYFTASPAYRNHSIKSVFTNCEAGKRGVECGDEKDFQANCFTKAALLVAKYGGTDELVAKAEEAIRVQQNNFEAVKFGLAGVRLLEKVVVQGLSVEQALDWAASPDAAFADDVRELLVKGLATRTTPLRVLQYDPPPFMKGAIESLEAIKDTLPAYTWATWCNGPSCANPAAFANVSIAAANFKSYADAVRANILAGGDNASRAIFIGALFAAEGGLDAIPPSWREKTKGYAEFEELVDKLLA